MQITCKCLNVSAVVPTHTTPVTFTDEEMQALNATKNFKIRSNSPPSPNDHEFKKHVESLVVSKMPSFSMEHAYLVVTKPVLSFKDWIIYHCSNCKMDVFLAMNDTVVFSPDVQCPEESRALTESSSYMSAFRIVIEIDEESLLPYEKHVRIDNRQVMRMSEKAISARRYQMDHRISSYIQKEKSKFSIFAEKTMMARDKLLRLVTDIATQGLVSPDTVSHSLDTLLISKDSVSSNGSLPSFSEYRVRNSSRASTSSDRSTGVERMSLSPMPPNSSLSSVFQLDEDQSLNLSPRPAYDPDTFTSDEEQSDSEDYSHVETLGPKSLAINIVEPILQKARIKNMESKHEVEAKDKPESKEETHIAATETNSEDESNTEETTKSTEFIPPHTLLQEDFFSMAKVKYVDDGNIRKKNTKQKGKSSKLMISVQPVQPHVHNAHNDSVVSLLSSSLHDLSFVPKDR